MDADHGAVLAVRDLSQRHAQRRSDWSGWLDALYFVGYTRAVEKRPPGFGIQALACVLLFLGALIGVVRHLAG